LFDFSWFLIVYSLAGMVASGICSDSDQRLHIRQI